MMFTKLLPRDEKPVSAFLACKDHGDEAILHIDGEEDAVLTEQPELLFGDGIGSQGFQVLGFRQGIPLEMFESGFQQFSASPSAEPLEVFDCRLFDFDGPA